MAKPNYKNNPRISQIFKDLESYLDFCKTFGYAFDERDLYANKSFIYRQYQKFLSGKPFKDNWEFDVRRRS